MKLRLSFIIVCCLIISISNLSTLANSNVKGIFTIEKCARLEGGFLIERKFNNHNSHYFPGGSLQYSYCLKAGQYLGLGLGAGVNLFKEEGFIPFYFDIITLINKRRNSPFINLQTGYAFGWSNEYNQYHNPEFSGGLCFGLTLGKKFHIRDRSATYISLSYKHQLAEIKYKTEDMESYNEKLNFPMLLFSIGLMLEQE